MEGTGTGERIDLPELRQIAMAQLLVVGHIKIRASNATILNTSEYVLAWLVGSKGMHFERPDILGKSRRAVAALNKTFVTELIAATREAFFPGTTCVLAAVMFWREMRSAVEETGSGAPPSSFRTGTRSSGRVTCTGSKMRMLRWRRG